MTRKSTRSRRLFPALPKVAKNNLLDSLGVTAVNYKDTARLRMFISERGKIRSRRVTGLAVRRFAVDELMFADGARLLSEDLPGSYRNRST